MDSCKKGNYWVELVETDFNFGDYIGDIERISSPCQNIEDIERNVKSLMIDFEEEIKSEKYYIKIKYVNIKYD